MKHDCRCVTEWSDELGHPMYINVCSTHRQVVPLEWGGLMAIARPKPGPSKARQAVKATA